MKRSLISLCMILCVCCMISGCGEQEEQKIPGTTIYYMNADETGLVEQEYEEIGNTSEEIVEHMLEDLQKESDSIDYKSVFPVDLKIENWSLKNEKVDLHFNSEYRSMDASREVLLRAAIVQTIGQLDDVDYIGFFIGDDPLLDNEGNEIGYVSPDDFVKNTGSSLHSYQETELKLYFSNAKGDKLSEENVNVRYNSNTSVEKLIVEQLLKGPRESGDNPVIPINTKVLGVSVRDGICYVNFDEGFLNNVYTIDPKITIYAIVNSIIDGGDSSRVQIMVNGETNVKYMENVDLSKPFSRDSDLIEGE